jgi:hypothetical protein
MLYARRLPPVCGMKIYDDLPIPRVALHVSDLTILPLAKERYSTLVVEHSNLETGSLEVGVARLLRTSISPVGPQVRVISL